MKNTIDYFNPSLKIIHMKIDFQKSALQKIAYHKKRAKHYDNLACLFLFISFVPFAIWTTGPVLIACCIALFCTVPVLASMSNEEIITADRIEQKAKNQNLI